jgi:hypothetical protein
MLRLTRGFCLAITVLADDFRGRAGATGLREKLAMVVKGKGAQRPLIPITAGQS